MNDPLAQRHEALRQEVQSTGLMVVADGVATHGEQLLAAVQEADLEGVMAKRLDSPYWPGRRSPMWQKILRHHTGWFWVTAIARAADDTWYWRLGESQGSILKPIGTVRAPTPWRPGAEFDRETILDAPFLVQVQYRERTRAGGLRHARPIRWPMVDRE